MFGLSVLRFGRRVLECAGRCVLECVGLCLSVCLCSVPHGVRGTDTASYIMCPLIADAIGMPHWFPVEVCPRPHHLGAELMSYQLDDAISPGGSGFVLTYTGPTWAQVVEALQRRFEQRGLDVDGVIARMDGRLHWSRLDQETWVGATERASLHMVEESSGHHLVWDLISTYALAVIHMRERSQARLARRINRTVTPEVQVEAEFGDDRTVAAGMAELRQLAEFAAQNIAEYTRRMDVVEVSDPADDFCRDIVPTAEMESDAVCLVCADELVGRQYSIGCCPRATYCYWLLQQSLRSSGVS